MKFPAYKKYGGKAAKDKLKAIICIQ